MSLLTICQDAADEIGISRPTSIASNTAPDAQKLLRYCNKVGGRLMRAAIWQALRKEQTFTAVSTETQTDIIPDDFDRFIPETFWDRSSSTLVIGPISAVQWAGLKATDYGDSCRRRFIYRGGAVSVIPTFAGGEALAFEYVSSQWAQSSASVAQTKFLADGDTALISEELIKYGVIYEYLRGDGLPFDVARMDYESQFNLSLENDQPDAGIMMAGDIFGSGRRFSGAPPVSGWDGSL